MLNNLDFNFKINVNIISGRDCMIQNADKFSEYGKKALIVCGKSGAKRSGALDDTIKCLKKTNTEYLIFDEISANPLLSACYKGGRIAIENNVDFIIGIGGGSALDAAKAVCLYATNPDMMPEDIYSSKRNKPLPLVAIGTTAGTGSEIGKVSVLTNDKTGRKKSISGDDLYPALTFADPKYTYFLSSRITYSTALDALCHAIEGYFSPSCGDVSAMFALKACDMIWNTLKRVDSKSLISQEDRDMLYYGSLYAGITLANCGTAFPHPLGYILTENYDVPHGFACSAFLPEFMERAKKYELLKTEILLNTIKDNFDEFCKDVKRFTKLPDIQMTEDELESYLTRFDSAIPKNFLASPGSFTKDDARRVLLKFVK